MDQQLQQLKDLLENKAREQEKETAEQEEEQAEENIDLTGIENKRFLEGGYRSFVIRGISLTDIHIYVDLDKLHIKALIEH